MNHENQIKDYERRLQGMGDAIVEKDAAASKLRVEIDSLRLTNQRLVAEVERMRAALARYKMDNSFLRARLDESEDRGRGGMSTLDDDGVQQTL